MSFSRPLSAASLISSIFFSPTRACTHVYVKRKKTGGRTFSEFLIFLWGTFRWGDEFEVSPRIMCALLLF